MMVKQLIWLAAGAMLFLSCKKDGDTDHARVSFAAPSLETKVLNEAIQGTEYPKAENFSVIVATTDSDWSIGNTAPATTAFMGKTGGGSVNPYGVSCGYNPGIGASGAWDPESGVAAYGGGTAYYWENAVGKKLQVQAYSPSGAHLDMNSGTGLSHDWATGFAFTNFTTPAVGSMYDLMYSGRTYNATRGAGDPAPVAVGFSHALSSIVFMAALRSLQFDQITIHLTSMTLKNVYRTGTFQQGLKSTRESVSPYTDGYPLWTVDTGSEGDLTGFIPEADLVFANYEATEGWVVSDKALLVIPQVLDREAPEPDLELEVNFTITDPSGSVANQQLSFPLFSDMAPAWLPGKRYVYRVYLEPQLAYVAVRVLDWEAQNVDI